MGHLLSSAIKMQNGGGGGTATLQYELYTSGFSGTFRVYRNGSIYQTMTTNTSLVTVTLNAGDTFYTTIQSSAGTSIDYFVNDVYNTSYYNAGTNTTTSPTITASAGNTYKYTAYFGVL